MMSGYKEVETFLRAPEGMMDAFWKDGPLLWVDWRDYDEDIVQAICESLPESARFRFEVRNSALPRGLDILLEKNGVLTAIPYRPDRLDRDTTLKAVQAAIASAYQLRIFVPSIKNDTVGFCLLSTPEWQRLETFFGPPAVACQFQAFGPGSCIFG